MEKEKNKEKVLGYISRVGKANEYRMASVLKIDAGELTEALNELEKEGKIEISSGVAKLIKEAKARPAEEGIKEKIEALKEKQKLALNKLREAVKILEESS